MTGTPRKGGPVATAADGRLQPSDIALAKQTIDLGEAMPDRASAAVEPTEAEADAVTGLTQSVDRAIRIIEFLADQPQEARLQDIADALRLKASTCHHLLQTLTARRYVTHSARSRKYSFGPRMIELTEQRVRQVDFVDEIMPELDVLLRAAGESVHLAVMDGTDLALVRTLRAARADSVEGGEWDLRWAAHATALGKAILAWLPETQTARVVAEKGLQRFTGKTIGNLGELLESLRQTRRFGFAIEDEEFRPDVIAVAAAFRDSLGAVIGAVGCSLPAERGSRDELQRVQQATTDCAGAISRRFGILPPHRIPFLGASVESG